MSIKYALHYSHISFSFLKGETKEFSTNGRDNKFEALKVLIRNCKPDREMIEIPLTDCEFCKYSGLLSNSSFTLKQKQFILFVNGRLVDSLEIRKVLDEVYAKVMPKSQSYFIYLSLIVPSNEVDVNVHPTKKELSLSRNFQITSEITNRVSEILASSNSSRNLTLKSFEIPKPALIKTQYAKSQVRESPSTPLEWFIETKPNQPKKKSEENLRSIEILKEKIVVGKEQELFNKFIYVGAVNKENVIVQHESSLYMINSRVLFETFIYQYILDNFAQLSFIEIQNSSLKIDSLIDLALENPLLGYNPDTDGDKSSMISYCSSLLSSKSDMLDDYFSLTISSEVLQRIPSLLDGLIHPDIQNLPEFLLRLCTDVN